MLTARADAFLMVIARIEVINFCFMRAKEVESPGLIGYSTPRLLNVQSDLRMMSCGSQPGAWTWVRGGKDKPSIVERPKLVRCDG